MRASLPTPLFSIFNFNYRRGAAVGVVEARYPRLGALTGREAEDGISNFEFIGAGDSRVDWWAVPAFGRRGTAVILSGGVTGYCEPENLSS